MTITTYQNQIMTYIILNSDYSTATISIEIIQVASEGKFRSNQNATINPFSNIRVGKKKHNNYTNVLKLY